MENKRSVKLNNIGIEFLDRLKINRIKASSDMDILPYWKLLELIRDFFLTNPEQYRKLLIMEDKDGKQ